jgi:hypothetical protein
MDTIGRWELLIIVLASGAVHEGRQPCGPDATRESGTDRPLGR